jgi:hypothetical protein
VPPLQHAVLAGVLLLPLAAIMEASCPSLCLAPSDLSRVTFHLQHKGQLLPLTQTTHVL